MDSDDEETFVTFGTPLPLLDADEAEKQTPSLQLIQKQKKGRERFHGAFTGGFSAGYFNSVGSKDGFTPATFVSSRERKEKRQSQLPEDFMDDEDFSEHGIAPKSFQTASMFSSEERQKRRFLEAKALTSGTVISGAPALTDLILPQKMTIGIKLLRRLGWREGQGIGARTVKRKQMQDTEAYIIGCSLPPEMQDNEDSDMENVNFSAKDTNPISFDAKSNVHGIGYRGLNPGLALPSSHINLFEPPPITKSGRKGIRGHAFGVGALEEDDDDIYAVDHLSNYDITMKGQEDEGDDTYGWTAPGRKKHKEQSVPMGYVGKMLEGFSLSSKSLKPKKTFPPPSLPTGYKPVHQFRKKFAPPIGTEDKKSSSTHNAVSRGLILGESPIINSVFDIISKEDRKKIEDAKKMPATIDTDYGVKKNASVLEYPHVTANSSVTAIPNVTANVTAYSNVTADPPVVSHSSIPADHGQTGSNYLNQTSVTSEEKTRNLRSDEPLYRGVGTLFKPFAKDPKKQERYERYQSLLKEGHKDAYAMLPGNNMTEWEKEHEESEFTQAAKLYKPLPGMIASRFTQAKYRDDDMHVDVTKETELKKSDEVQAAEKKMYGALTRQVHEWHPDPVVCKRFNVSNPYPGSTMVGLRGSKRDKMSIFNFLDFSGPDDPVSEQRKPDQPKALTDSSNADKELEKQAVSFKLQRKGGLVTPATSIFSGLMDDTKRKASSSVSTDKSADHLSQESSQTPKDSGKQTEVTPDEESNPDQERSMDLFEAIFGNTDSESEEEKEESASTSQQELEKEKQDNEENIVSASVVPYTNQTVHTQMNLNTQGSKSPEQEGMLPGAPVPIDTLSSRLKPEVPDENEEAYGPALPPPVHQDQFHEKTTAHLVEEKRKSSHHRSSYKEKHKHKHKKDKKSKKSKHKKSDKKKSKKKYDSDSEYEASNSSDSDNTPSNREILDKLKSISSSGKNYKLKHLV